MTTLIMRRGDEVRRVEAPRCPMFDFDDLNKNEPAVREAINDGFRIIGHVDQAKGAA